MPTSIQLRTCVRIAGGEKYATVLPAGKRSGIYRLEEKNISTSSQRLARFVGEKDPFRKDIEREPGPTRRIKRNRSRGGRGTWLSRAPGCLLAAFPL